MFHWDRLSNLDSRLISSHYITRMLKLLWGRMHPTPPPPPRYNIIRPPYKTTCNLDTVWKKKDPWNGSLAVPCMCSTNTRRYLWYYADASHTKWALTRLVWVCMNRNGGWQTLVMGLSPFRHVWIGGFAVVTIWPKLTLSRHSRQALEVKVSWWAQNHVLSWNRNNVEREGRTWQEMGPR